MEFLVLIITIYFLGIGSALGLSKLFAAKFRGADWFVGMGVTVLIAALESPWYIDSVLGLSGNILKSAGAIVAMGIPIGVAVAVHSVAVHSAVQRHSSGFCFVFSFVVGSATIPFGLAAFVIVSCIAGDCS